MKLGIIKKAAVALAVSTAASAGMTGAAFASKNTHKYQTSGEAQRQQQQPVDPCEGIWGQFANDVKQAGIADKNGQTGARDNWLVLADAALEAGQKAGCGWAARTTVPTYGPAPVIQTVKTRVSDLGRPRSCSRRRRWTRSSAERRCSTADDPLGGQGWRS